MLIKAEGLSKVYGGGENKVRSGFSHGGKIVLRWKGHIWIE